ncbi:MAG TPA: efflux RND transporter periplasmic adaptor subunit [bacterium]|nr:efflux RND transporter periplasmic adaptor subunit [bacterium]
MKKALKFLIPLALVVAGLVIWRVQTSTFYYAGTVEATEVDVSAQVSSTIQSRPVDEGQAVTQGQVLAILDGSDYRIQQKLAEDDYQRGLKLFQSGSLSTENFNHLKSQKELADLRVDWCTLASPLQATVLTKYHEPGELVVPGTKIFTLADLREVWAYFYVPQPVMVQLHYGDKLTAFLPELKGHDFTGAITHINDEAEFTPKNVQTREERTRLVYAVKVTFPNREGYLKPGMTLETSLTAGRSK